MNKVHCLKRIIACLSGKPTKEIDGTTVCTLLDELCDSIDAGNTYANEEEIDTGKKWVDGKPIYRLTVKATLGTLAGVINEHTPETIVSFFGQTVSMYGNRLVIPSITSGDSRYKIDFLQSNVDDHIEIQYGDFLQADYSAYCVIEYTKKSEG